MQAQILEFPYARIRSETESREATILKFPERPAFEVFYFGFMPIVIPVGWWNELYS